MTFAHLEELQKMILDSKKFRSRLVENMKYLESNEINCQKCTGICCTVARNSMQVTPLEALDLYFEIENKILDNDNFWKKNAESISLYGLDREIYVKNKLLRKNYTCPLFKFESWGCPIDRHLKPLGCLGYNAIGKEVIEGENCKSDIEFLENLEKEINLEWNQINSDIKKLLNLNFDKLPIPRALEEVKKILNS